MKGIFCTVLVFLSVSLAFSNGETILSIITKTSNCDDCGMSEAEGSLAMEVCGKNGCCAIDKMDNDETNFESGKFDKFLSKESLQTCFDFAVCKI